MAPRTTTRRARVAVLAVSALAVALAGCGDDGESIDPDADEEVIEEVALRESDLPDGFVENEGGGESGSVFEECGEEVDLDPDEVDENKVAEGGDDVAFLLEGEDVFVQVGSSVTSVRDAGLARRQIEAFDDDDFIDCVTEELETILGENGDITDFELDRTDPGADGDAAAALTMDFVSGGFPFEMQVHLVVVDRFGIVLQVLSGPEPVADDLVEDALDEMLDRLDEARG